MRQGLIGIDLFQDLPLSEMQEYLESMVWGAKVYSQGLIGIDLFPDLPLGEFQ